jgi:hypothetical protein
MVKEHKEVETTKIILKHDSGVDWITGKPPSREESIFDSYTERWTRCFSGQIINQFGYFAELILGVLESLKNKISSIKLRMP